MASFVKAGWKRRRRAASAVALAFVLCAAFGGLALAIFKPVDRQLQVSVTGADGDSSRNAYEPALAFNPERSEYLAVWRADGLSNEEYEIFGQRLSLTGVRLGPPLRISNTTEAGAGRDAGEVSVTYNPQANQYLVVWAGDGLFVDNQFEILGQFVSASGSIAGSDFRVSNVLEVAGDRDAARPDVAYRSVASEYLVVWRSNQGPASGGFDIWGQRLDADGVEQGSDFRISNATDVASDRDAALPRVVHNPQDSEYLVAWSSDHVADEKYEIFGQRLNATGAAEGSDFRISNTGLDTDPMRDATSVDLAYDSSDNEYLAAFGADRFAAGTDDMDPASNEEEIFGQLISAAGDEVGSDFRVSETGADGSGIQDARAARVAYGAPSDEYLVTWHADRADDEEYEVYAQRLGADAGAVGSDFRISRTGADGDSAPRALFADVARATTAGEYLTLWEATNPAGTEFEIFGRRIGQSANCAGRAATRQGTSQADLMVGGTGAEVFALMAGGDTANGRVGNDTMCGAGGNDQLDGGGANDTIQGDSGDDTLRGGAGNDRLIGGPGSQDRCIGGGGTDTFAASCETRVQ